MRRREFVRWVGGSAPLARSALQGASSRSGDSGASILLPTLPCAAPLPEVVLFGFDNRAFPFQNQVQTRLSTGQNPRLVLRHGPPASHDEVLLYYGTVIRIGD